jgi:hypothetical protein
MSLPPHMSIPAPRRPVEDGDWPGWRVAGSLTPPAGALSQLVQAGACLREAERAARPTERYVAAHLAALRAATAVLVARSWDRDGSRPVNVWRVLIEVAPELREWARYFAAGSSRRAAAEAGIPGVSSGEADDLMCRAGEFLDVVGRALLGASR